MSNNRPTLTASLQAILLVSDANARLIKHLNALVEESRGEDILLGADAQISVDALQKVAAAYANVIRGITWRKDANNADM